MATESTGGSTGPDPDREAMAAATARAPQSRLEFRGSVEVVIDELGRVTSVRVIEPIHPAYDPQRLAAAKVWRYQPARRKRQADRFDAPRGRGAETR